MFLMGGGGGGAVLLDKSPSNRGGIFYENAKYAHVQIMMTMT